MNSAPLRERLVTALLVVLAVGLGLLGNSLAGTDVPPERAIALTGAAFLGTGAILMAAWLQSRQWRLTMDVVSFGVFSVALVLLVATYFTAELRSILYRGDFLIWSESPFVNDIIKFRSGGTLYDTPSDLSSFYYTPGAPLLTWAAASVVGLGDSVPAYRVIQVLFVLLAVAMGVRTASLIRALRGGERPGLPWIVAWFPLLFLAATNALTNRFNHLLHNDALALLICAAAFLVMAEYATRPRPVLLAAMVLLPPAGFVVKQSLGIWCVLFGAWLLFFDRPFRFWRAVVVGGAGLALTLLLYAGALVLWGDNFRFWAIEGLANHAVSPLRSIQHAIDGWAFWAAGLFGGWILLRGERARALLGLWLVWAALFAIETYTSGIAWMLNHMGPGSFVAVVWLAAALPAVWPTAVPTEGGRGLAWLRAGLVTAMALFALGGLHSIRPPLASLPLDADRYASDIELEFADRPATSVLLDHGSWLYLREGIVQKDRSAAAGEAGWTGATDFRELMGRIRSHHYDRILVRDLHAPSFMYDYHAWESSSGVRDTLLRYYREARVIPAVEAADNIWLRPISVLEPREEATPTAATR